MGTKQTSTAANSKKGRVARKLKDTTAQPSKRGRKSDSNSTDPEKIKEWLDKTVEGPWTVHAIPVSNKRKRDAPSKMLVEDRLFEERLNVQYEVKPRDRWEALKTYKKFTVASESIATGDCILVGHSDGGEDADTGVDLADQWKAVVLEVRALDSEHVYLRVGWLNRPEDLDSGRKDYHGENELIPTNQMDVIDAMTVNGKIDVTHWDENDTDAQMVNENQYFWRQTFDYVGSKTFSKLRQICKDNRPQNPDEMIIECPNADCGNWLHARCVVEQAAKAAAEEASGKAKSNTHKKRQSRNVYTDTNRTPPAAKAKQGNFTAELYLASPPSTEPDEISVKPAATKPEIIITDPKGEKQAQDLYCLCCSKPIE
ncbi:hypothetical protein M409DRAFT_68019 [Zasmidium cellare ATCC 36951]|uniref:BAH domain-containing protein n=1 Tax=Zasmidium cellare ATCC 36951 TaxID=1080233 RepID=A0A6A6CD02_ZASCE|nr:uncharacterized protein M409DRAFT_68019 [Zasmidium cellare ATCC 36951]KAF2164080.1 hypothetical protein M409DRAFT_68019 [Zasmidium cellare ATCC 36951]